MKLFRLLLGLAIFFLLSQGVFSGKEDGSTDDKSEKAGALEEKQAPPIDPFGIRWKPPEEARPATIYLSNDKKVSGLIYSTRGKPFRIFDEKLKKNVDVYIPEILTIQTVVE